MSDHFLVIRAVVQDSEREAFDNWYGAGHMSEALEKMKADRAWRFWSVTQPWVHYAVYSFADPSVPLEIKRRADREGGATLAWPNVAISREVVAAVGSAGPRQPR